MVQMTTTIHTTDLMLSEPNDYKITLRFDGPPFDGPLNAATPSVAKEAEAVTLSVCPLRYAIWSLEMLLQT